MMGVIKLLDRHGKMVDQAPWFGGIGPLTFGQSNRPYVVASALFVDGTGIPQLVGDFFLSILETDRPVITFTPDKIDVTGFIPHSISEQ